MPISIVNVILVANLLTLTKQYIIPKQILHKKYTFLNFLSINLIAQ